MIPNYSDKGHGFMRYYDRSQIQIIKALLLRIQAEHNSLKRKFVPSDEIEAFFKEAERKQQKCFNEWKNGIELLDGAEWSSSGPAGSESLSSSGSCSSVNRPEPFTQDFMADAGPNDLYLSDAESSARTIADEMTIDISSPLDQFSIHPLIPLALALGLGLFLLLVFFFLRKVWKNR